MTAFIVADLAYGIALVCYLGAFLLILEWLAHLLPGSGLNPVRRSLFLVSFPLLSFSDRFFSIKSGSFNTRGLLTSFLLITIGRYGIPLLVALSYSMRG